MEKMSFADSVDVVLECTRAESSAQTGFYSSTSGDVCVQIGLGKSNHTLPLGIM